MGYFPSNSKTSQFLLILKSNFHQETLTDTSKKLAETQVVSIPLSNGAAGILFYLPKPRPNFPDYRFLFLIYSG